MAMSAAHGLDYPHAIPQHLWGASGVLEPCVPHTVC